MLVVATPHIVRKLHLALSINIASKAPWAFASRAIVSCAAPFVGFKHKSKVAHFILNYLALSTLCTLSTSEMQIMWKVRGLYIYFLVLSVSLFGEKGAGISAEKVLYGSFFKAQTITNL